MASRWASWLGGWAAGTGGAAARKDSLRGFAGRADLRAGVARRPGRRGRERAGTTELQRVNGLWTNKVAITNGPGAGLGTYVGTVRTNGSATVDMKFGTLAASGGESRICVWNMFNRVSVAALVRDSTDSWTLAASSTRSANASATMRCSFVCGLVEDLVSAMYACSVNAAGQAAAGVGLDSTTTFSGYMMFNGSGNYIPAFGGYNGLPGLGFHYLQALEASQVSGTQTFYGDVGVTYYQNGLSVGMRA